MMRTRSLTAWIAGLALLLALAGCQDSGGVNSGANGPGDLTPVRALDFRARNSHAADKGS